jgi:hypothetical protein
VKRLFLALVAAFAIGFAFIPASASAAPEAQRHGGWHNGHHGHHGYNRGTTVVVEQVAVPYAVYPTYATYAPTYAVVYCPAFGYYTYANFCP